MQLKIEELVNSPYRYDIGTPWKDENSPIQRIQDNYKANNQNYISSI